MLIRVCKAKIHRAKVTKTLLHYEGSIAIAEELLASSGILANEEVQVLNFNNGERFTTYAVKGKPDSGICLLGPAAYKGKPGDLITIIAYALLEEKKAVDFIPKVVYVDENNRIKLKGGQKNERV